MYIGSKFSDLTCSDNVTSILKEYYNSKGRNFPSSSSYSDLLNNNTNNPNTSDKTGLTSNEKLIKILKIQNEHVKEVKLKSKYNDDMLEVKPYTSYDADANIDNLNNIKVVPKTVYSQKKRKTLSLTANLFSNTQTTKISLKKEPSFVVIVPECLKCDDKKNDKNLNYESKELIKKFKFYKKANVNLVLNDVYKQNHPLTKSTSQMYIKKKETSPSTSSSSTKNNNFISNSPKGEEMTYPVYYVSICSICN